MHCSGLATSLERWDSYQPARARTGEGYEQYHAQKQLVFAAVSRFRGVQMNLIVVGWTPAESDDAAKVVSCI